MVDDDVEIVLREIRERVISETRAEQIARPSIPETGNGNAVILAADEEQTSAAAELARLDGYLTTTGRSWDRLPPVFSNRSGAVARLELWLKRRAKSLGRWFTWEQVNFNAAVHHALRETHEALLGQQAALNSLSKSMQREAETRRTEVQDLHAQTGAGLAELNARIAELSARVENLAADLRVESDARRIDLQNQKSDINTLRAELHGESETRRIQIEDSAKQLSAVVEAHERQQAGQVLELNERDDRIESEHRVSFKQLSLENSETAAFYTTSRQKLESAITELDQRIKQLETAVKRGQ